MEKLITEKYVLLDAFIKNMNIEVSQNMYIHFKN